MRVTCPECGSKFKVPDKALGTTGRKLRCGQCSHEWFQEPGAPAPELKSKPKGKPKPGGKPAGKPKARPAPPPEPEEAFGEEPAAESDAGDGFSLRAQRDQEMDPPPLGGLSRFRGPRSSDGTRRRPPVALLVLAASAVAIPAILFAGRESLVEVWQPSALLYDTVGTHVPVPGEGLVLQNVYVQRRQEGSVPLLVVTGEIRNPGGQLRSLPALRGTVLDEHGDLLQSWLFAAEVPQLLPGDTGRFQSELASPPEGASRVNVSFSHERPEGGIGY